MEQEKPLSARQVAAYCHVNLKTVLKWIEQATLKAYQLPGSGVNRIQKSDLIDFMTRFSLPIPPELRHQGIPKLLIVDDETNVLSALRRLLRSSEFQIETANDGFEAGRKIEIFKPDILLMDLNMPGISGKEVLKQIKGNPATQHIQVIILSGFVDADEKNMLIEIGAKGVLDKPVDRQELISLLGIPIAKEGVRL
jgi:excisionase family DNA binding protein